MVQVLDVLRRQQPAMADHMVSLLYSVVHQAKPASQLPLLLTAVQHVNPPSSNGVRNLHADFYSCRLPDKRYKLPSMRKGRFDYVCHK